MSHELKHCELCGCSVEETTRHHFIPVTRHKNKKNKKMFTREEVQKKAEFCRPCHGQVHALFTEKELERTYNTLEKLREHPEVIKFIQWIRKH